MRLPYYQINAFTSQPFGGNPAGICPLEKWLPDAVMQQIAAENNLAETAFFVWEKDFYHLRWFTPTMEVDLCGHATLATAYALFNELGYNGDQVRFHTRSGWLAATRGDDGLVEIDLPARPPGPWPAPEELLRGLGRKPREVLKSRDYFAVYESPEEVAALAPDFEQLGQVKDCVGIIATAHGGRDGADFVSRFFAPSAGIPEDPVTGSAHCTLVPYWSALLGKTHFVARQISRRGGELFCRLEHDRVFLGGHSAVYCRGELEVPTSF